jgi:outer membrane protein assembly factor BamD (BamD/ComL family)
MTSMIRNVAVLCFVALAACATGGGGGTARSVNDRFRQADHRLPEPSNFRDDDERSRIQMAYTPLQRGDLAATAGNMDQARAEWRAAADAFAAFTERFKSSEWRIPLRYKAAELYMRGQQPEKAAQQAEQILVDPMAKDASKAMAAHLAAMAWQNAAVAQSKAGQLEPIKLPTADQRQGAPLKPRPPPGAWKRFVETTDQYLKFAAAEPELQKPRAERRFQLGPSNLALIAAEVEYAFDNMEDARRRFEQIIQSYANEPEVMEDAVPLYLQTFLILGDDAGYRAAIARVKGVLQAQAQQATDPKAKEAYAKIGDSVARMEQGSGFTEASALMEQNKFAEAAAAFEKFANEYPGNPDAPNALYNAGIAYDKAQQPEKSAAVREKLLAQFGDNQKIAPQTALMLGQHYSKKNQHAEAAKLYDTYLQKWPDGDFKCVALQNIAYEYDVQNKRAEAAERYFGFGTDAKCSKEDPNSAAKTLFRAGQLFEKAKQRAKAKAAYAAAAGVQNVTDTVAQSQVTEARRKAKQL